jgi:sulfate permease, SulP family
MPDDAQGASSARASVGATPDKLGRWQRWLPGLMQLRHYRGGLLAGDSLAGVSVCIVMIPSVIAYSALIGLPPQHGLYAALVPMLVYALFGSSKQVIVGPDIAISLLMASAVAPLAAGNPVKAAGWAAVLALLSGLLLLLAARANLGVIADFLSKPVLVGYMTGAALILMASQLGKLFGVDLRNADFFPRILELFKKLGSVHLPTLILGVGCLLVLIFLRRISPKIPATLIVCVAAILISATLELPGRGVAVVGVFPRGLPAFEIPTIDWHALQSLTPAAIGIALLTYTEGILLARAFAAKNGYEVSANQELVALGLADLASGVFQGFSITGSQARTTINDATGGKTQVVSLVCAGTLALFLLFMTSLISRLPQVALAAILIFAGFGLVEFDVMARIYRYYPRSAVVAALTTLSVLIAGVVPGIVFGVALSLLGLISRISHPADAVLSEVAGRGFHDVGAGPGTQTMPGLVAYRFYAPLLFPNAAHFVEQVRKLVARCPTTPRWLLLDAQAITDIDVTAVEILHSLNEELRRQGIALKIAHANPPLRALLTRTGLASEIGSESFFNSVHECVEAFKLRAATPVPNPSR